MPKFPKIWFQDSLVPNLTMDRFSIRMNRSLHYWGTIPPVLCDQWSPPPVPVGEMFFPSRYSFDKPRAPPQHRERLVSPAPSICHHLEEREFSSSLCARWISPLVYIGDTLADKRARVHFRHRTFPIGALEALFLSPRHWGACVKDMRPKSEYAPHPPPPPFHRTL